MKSLQRRCIQNAFNSFEDETWVIWSNTCIEIKNGFQFLWGWNQRTPGVIHRPSPQLSIPLRMKLFIREIRIRLNCRYSFNSFEDETLMPYLDHKPAFLLSIPLRMKHGVLTPCGGLVVKRSFNSFEDETSPSQTPQKQTSNLSIPLRMKQRMI